ncbi:MAG: helix-turn-helix domain-containing protein [Caulobacteraceae bacterium]
MPLGIDVRIGKRISARRRALGLTQRELGEAIGVSFQQISKIESGVPMSSGRLWAITQALGVPVCLFFDGCSNGVEATAAADCSTSAPAPSHR